MPSRLIRENVAADNSRVIWMAQEGGRVGRDGGR